MFFGSICRKFCVASFPPVIADRPSRRRAEQLEDLRSQQQNAAEKALEMAPWAKATALTFLRDQFHLDEVEICTNFHAFCGNNERISKAEKKVFLLIDLIGKSQSLAQGRRSADLQLLGTQ